MRKYYKYDFPFRFIEGMEDRFAARPFPSNLFSNFFLSFFLSFFLPFSLSRLDVLESNYRDTRLTRAGERRKKKRAIRIPADASRDIDKNTGLAD